MDSVVGDATVNADLCGDTQVNSNPMQELMNDVFYHQSTKADDANVTASTNANCIVSNDVDMLANVSFMNAGGINLEVVVAMCLLMKTCQSILPWQVLFRN